MSPRFFPAAAAAALTAVLLVGGCARGGQDARRAQYAPLNPQADFTLTDQDGKVFRLSDHRNQAVLLFFGYLSCPDICPTTLSKLASVYSLLGPARRSKVLTVFVSIDTQRDTPAKLKQYLSYFGINAVGLTGSKAAVDKVVDAYKASYRKVETHSALGYLYDHSDFVYLIDTQGHVEYLFHADDAAQDIAKAVARVLL